LHYAHLTRREIDVLCLIGKGYSVEDASKLLKLSADTVKGYVKSIYARLGVSNRSDVTIGGGSGLASSIPSNTLPD